MTLNYFTNCFEYKVKDLIIIIVCIVYVCVRAASSDENIRFSNKNFC